MEHSLSIISKNSVYFSKPEELNDPYEGFSRIDTSLLRRTHSELFPEDEELEATFHSRMRGDLRIFSLSETCRSSTMWSHYADSHRGICIGLNTVDMKNLAPVSYFSNTPIIDGQDSESIVNGVALSKSFEWEYEREWRAIKFAPQQLVPLPADAVSEVILGCEITRENAMIVVRDLMLRSIRHSPVRLYTATRSRDEYDIVPKDLGLADGRSAVDSAGILDLEAMVDLSLKLLDPE